MGMIGKDATPEEVGFDSTRLKVLDEHFQKMIDEDRLICGVYCLARDGKIFASKALGHINYDYKNDPRPVKEDTMFRIASISKLVTAVAIFQLVEDGKLLLNTKIGTLIPEFNQPPLDDITVAMILSHTAGFPADENAIPGGPRISMWDGIFLKKSGNWIEDSLACGLATKPGTEWAYCTFGYYYLGEVISRVSGMHAYDYVTERILKPLHMEDSGFIPMLNNPDRQMIRTKCDQERVDMIKGKIEKKLDEDDEFYYSLRIPEMGSALYSTAFDLMKFGIMLEQKGTYKGTRILGRKAWEKMTEVYIDTIPSQCWGANGTPRRYGLGPDRGCDLEVIYSPTTFFHEGAGSCSLTIDPSEKLTAVWFCQFYGNDWFPDPLRGVINIISSGIM